MKANTKRQRNQMQALRELIPLAPYSDFSVIALAMRAQHMRSLAPVDGAFLATVAHIRHKHTDYDALLEEGYDHESARHFVAQDIEEQLLDWGSPRGLINPEAIQS